MSDQAKVARAQARYFGLMVPQDKQGPTHRLAMLIAQFKTDHRTGGGPHQPCLLEENACIAWRLVRGGHVTVEAP